jgi:hypothetical protein
LVIVVLVAALVVVTCWNQSTGQVAAPPARPAALKWEYKLIYISLEDAHMSELRRLGGDGWEACAAFPEGEVRSGSGKLSSRLVLKRPKVE